MVERYRPITPEEARAKEQKKLKIDPQVIEVFNEVIGENYENGVARVYKNALKEALGEKKLSGDEIIGGLKDLKVLRAVYGERWSVDWEEDQSQNPDHSSDYFIFRQKDIAIVNVVRQSAKQK